MGFNKTKSLDAAQKYLNQGKIAQAIQEYQEILRHEPRDQVTLMTVGDLYVRQGETFKALEFFERLAQLYAKDGFLTKAIAIYKKIAKLAPEETRPLERLAELYVQQGVMSEARPLYLQMAESHMRANRHAQAIGLLRKLLEAEPDNLRVHLRLAELHLALHQKKEAAATFLDCAERQFDRGDHAEAEKLANRALEIDSSLASALTLRARAVAAAGRHAEAASLLEKLPGLDSGGDVTELLIDQHLQGGNRHRAAEIARSVFRQDPKNFALAARVVGSLVEAGDGETALELLDEIREPMTEGGEQDLLAKLLQDAGGHLPGRLEPQEWLVQLYARVNDSFRLPEALAQLGEAAMKAGNLQRAQEVYSQLCERAPDDPNVVGRLNEIRVQLGMEPVNEVVRMVESKQEEPEGLVEPPLDDETQRFVAQSLTDADLFSSYGLSNKAMSLLEAVVQRAPRHTPSLEKLLDLYLGAGDTRRTAELASCLEQIYEQRKDSSNAERFSQLRKRFQQAAGLSDADLVAAVAPPAEPSLPSPEPRPGQAAASQANPPAGESLVHDVDLVDEWAALSDHIHSVEESPAPPVEEPAPEPEPVAELPPPPPPPPAPKAKPPAVVKEPAPPVPVAPTPMGVDEFLVELADELGGPDETPAVVEPPPPVAPVSSAPPKPVVAPPPPPPVPAAPPPAPVVPAAAASSTPPPLSAGGGPLADVFNEFRNELGELGSDEEDLETHYNLGTAYREMGLLEEAIGEFQKVAQASENGRPFQYTMQCCTLLGLAFMEKGQPQIASIWYEKALRTPGLDQESVLALRYDLGVAQEQAGDSAAAMKSFSEVYAINIDYRDVAERMTTLGKPR
jgi:tetratricopeptide (TPR) repeat protein